MAKMTRKILTVLSFFLIALLLSSCFTPVIVDQGRQEVYLPGDESSEASEQETAGEETGSSAESSVEDYAEYSFRTKKLLKSHYEKHGKEMGFPDAKSYEKAASDVINNPNALYKTESEDGDGVYYVEETNEFVILSTDGYIRTYFCPDKGIDYFNRQ